MPDIFWMFHLGILSVMIAWALLVGVIWLGCAIWEHFHPDQDHGRSIW